MPCFTAHFPSQEAQVTPLMCAARNGMPECIRELLKRGASIAVRDEARCLSPHLPSDLLNALGDTCSAATPPTRFSFSASNRNQNGCDVMHLACEGGHADCLALLIDAGGDVDSPDKARPQRGLGTDMILS